MGSRGPKPTREATTHIRVPISLARELRSAADSQNQSIASLLENLKAELLPLLPMPPNEGPPLPSGLGITWPWSANRKRKAKK